MVFISAVSIDKMAVAKIKILGNATRLDVVAVCVLVGAILAILVHSMLSGFSHSAPAHHPSKGHHGHGSTHHTVKEGLVGAPLKYSMQQGVPSSGPSMEGAPGSYSTWYTPLDGNTQGLKPPLPKGQLDIFAKNPSKPECCSASTYSTSTGCVCVTPKQMQYLNQRGGNRTLNTEY